MVNVSDLKKFCCYLLLHARDSSTFHRKPDKSNHIFVGFLINFHLHCTHRFSWVHSTPLSVGHAPQTPRQVSPPA